MAQTQPAGSADVGTSAIAESGRQPSARAGEGGGDAEQHSGEDGQAHGSIGGDEQLVQLEPRPLFRQLGEVGSPLAVKLEQMIRVTSGAPEILGALPTDPKMLA